MSNALGVGPAVMINRMVDRAGSPAGAHLAEVAALRMALMSAIDEKQHQAALLDPTSTAKAEPLSSGAVVDRLI